MQLLVINVKNNMFTMDLVNDDYDYILYIFTIATG